MTAANRPTAELTVHLVACCSIKLDHAAAAKDLYASPLFRKTRAVVEATGQPWFILSARFHLVHPECVIPPYDHAMSDKDRQERRLWARYVYRQLFPVLGKPPAKIVMWAGQLYRHPLTAELVKRGHQVRLPLHGLGIGEQLQRVDEMARALKQEAARVQ